MGFTMTMKVEGRTMKLYGAGAFDFDDARGAITMDASSILPAGSGDGTFELRMIGSKIYMQLPAALGGQGLTGGKQWVAIDVEKTLRQLGLGGIDPTNLQQDPTQTLQSAAGVVDERAEGWHGGRPRGRDDAVHRQARPEEVDRGDRGRARSERAGARAAPRRRRADVDSGRVEDDPGRDLRRQRRAAPPDAPDDEVDNRRRRRSR